MREIILFALIIVIGTFGELCVSRAMKAVGEVKDFRPRAILVAISSALRSGWMWVGLVMMAVAFFALLGALSVDSVSFVVPVTALSYLIGAFGGKFFLGEQVTKQRWIGVLLVALGVTLVIFSRR